MIPDFDTCYQAMQSRDARFDGWFFVAVSSTGIYCRPSCPAMTPQRRNVCFYPTAAAAQAAGFRACLRCRPDASPGSPEWNLRADVAGRAMRLIADGVVDREGVDGLARRLAYSPRQLRRLLAGRARRGAARPRARPARPDRAPAHRDDGPAVHRGRFRRRVRQPAAVQRHGARGLRAHADGDAPPRACPRSDPDASASAIRWRAAGFLAGREDLSAGLTSVHLRLPFREPLDADGLLAFFADRAISGVEEVADGTYRRTLRLPGGVGIVELTPVTGQAAAAGQVAAARMAAADRLRAAGHLVGKPVAPGHIAAAVHLSDLRDLGAAVGRCRTLLDLDADPQAVDAALGADPLLMPLVRRAPGKRVPGAADGLEIAVRAVLGQQVSVASARRTAARIAAALGEPLAQPFGSLTHVFPTAEALRDADDAFLPVPAARRATIRELARNVAAGALELDAGADRDETRRRLLEIPGIGPGRPSTSPCAPLPTRMPSRQQTWACCAASRPSARALQAGLTARPLQASPLQVRPCAASLHPCPLKRPPLTPSRSAGDHGAPTR